MKSAILPGLFWGMGIHPYKLTRGESIAIAGLMERFLDMRCNK